MSSDLFQEITLPTGVTYKQPVGLFINGQWIKTEETLETFNPATEEKITSVYVAGVKEVDQAVVGARAAFKKWKNVPGSEKATYVHKLADILEKNSDLIAAVEALDSGKPFESNCKADIGGTVDYLRYCAGWSDKILGKTIPISANKIALTKRTAIGVCGQIVPWNYPLSMSGWKIAPALAAGNCIIIKSAENTPLSLLLFATFVEEAGFPAGIVNIISGHGAVAGKRLAEHPDIDKIAFTGSTKVGSLIQQYASSNMKAVTLECGGKSPLIVFEDADLEQAAKWAAFGMFYNSGQNCTSNSRIYLQESIHDKFLEIFTEVIKKDYQIGEPFGAETSVGPVISKVQYDRIKQYIEIGKNEGAKLIIGDEPVAYEKGYYINPTVFINCTQDMKIVQEEIFGPVVAVSKFETEEEVIEKANDTIYGLASMVFTRDISRANRVADELESGMTFINSSNDEDFKVPFGGVKMSGIGRELGESGIELYTQVKAVHINIGTKL
ncbi:hypothetical protein BVG19_g2221 [[Candida] boidinii]|nr:hypothetical protein BVG19_g2221 [[Candida] boidinii]OWB50704.1 hypothetical protein B5S27_g2256 [[Candida] boidinii]OWB65269.1 hypothetical protein B5S30_g593 [[Candida] boidinii]OWB83017.1 hypothetical protein B5S33_g1646 [[Candida] boidinii]